MSVKLPSRLFAPMLVVLAFAFTQCDTDDTIPPDDTPTNTPKYSTVDSTFGFGVLAKVKGIWNGPVTSTTALGGFPEWIVDFRPISAHQVSAKNELDRQNDIHMSFFIAKHNGSFRVCFRNGGSFAGQTRVSYFLADSVSESDAVSYYRFSEIVKGENRAYTEVIFKQDSMILKSYTNKYNTQATSSPHMTWRAKLQDATSAQSAVTTHDFPKKELTKDFTATFSGQAEAIYYSITGGDPYPENAQPYLGQATINYSFAGGFTPDPNKKVFLIITTQPLISGFTINQANMRYRSRYVILAASDNSYTFNYMHPGTYYLYALYDADGNMTFSSGDRVSTVNTSFSLSAEGTASASASMNFVIP